MNIEIITYILMVLFVIYYVKYYNLRNKMNGFSFKQLIGLEPVKELQVDKVKEVIKDILKDIRNIDIHERKGKAIEIYNELIRRLISTVNGLDEHNVVFYAFMINDNTNITCYVRYFEEIISLCDEVEELISKEFNKQELAIMCMELVLALKGIYIRYYTKEKVGE